MSRRSQGVEVLDRDAEPAGLVFGRHRGRHAAQVGQPAAGEGGEEVGDGGAGAEPDRHAALDQLGRGFGGEALLVVGGQRFRDSIRLPWTAASTAQNDQEQSQKHDRHAHPGLQGRRHRPRRVRPQGDLARRGRDARPHADSGGVRGAETSGGRAHHGLAPHDGPDRGADRDAGRARRRGALVQLQHLLDPGPRRGGDRGGRGPGLRLEGRDAGGVLVVHRAGAELARRGRPEHDPRRRRRRDPAGPQRRRVRGGGRGARSLDRGLGGVPDRARDADPLARVRRDPRGPKRRPGSRASPRRRRPASTGSTSWPRPAGCCSRRSTSTTRSPSRSSTTSTAAATR